MASQTLRPALIPINVAIFVGLPLLALVLVPVWGIYLVTTGSSGFGRPFLPQWPLYYCGLSPFVGALSLRSGALALVFAFWGAGALQNSILVWASDHRHVDDRDRDPYAATKGGSATWAGC